MTRPWHPAIRVRFHDSGDIASVRNVFEAAFILLYRWPPEKGPAHSHAWEECSKVLRNAGDHDTAYRAFVDAAREAGILVA